MRKSVAALVAALACVAGCGGGGGRGDTSSSPTAAARITVTSTAYADGGTIPRRFTCDAANVSPPLAFSGVPAHTASLALLLQDRSAPHGAFTHWLVWGIDPHTTRLPAGGHPPGATEGRNDFRTPGYGGPCPPRGDRPHRYVLTVYATDGRLSLTAQASRDDLLRALSGHTLATGTLTGRYGR
ncbi:YbhB/YbcL family Raf kinase inhibitor-like protein [Streptomyces broussonetiae]|uniref:YbhB/YbcL family Raf kinase inhibitor-like protein n=1 Tax=Streptomyces broussonetiae TaxID=2686304 RepID=A0A6I6N2M6_9ACTN|nr:YbhB/YbcL family Raf kinase inhibitor-like protein [Streptomyces broussonetiae]QHA07438.1 YbhB/YbcL family Raf kinase inhibitor-like protein [Streptomyces broussonetiae]